MTATKLSDLTDHGYDGRKRALAAKAGLSRDTLALSGGLVIDPATKARQANGERPQQQMLPYTIRTSSAPTPGPSPIPANRADIRFPPSRG